MTLSISSLKSLVSFVGYSLADVKVFGDARLKSTWETCLSEFLVYHGIALDALQDFADGNIAAITEIVEPLTDIIEPIATVTGKAIDIVAPIVVSTSATVIAFVTDPETHKIAKLHSIRTVSAILTAIWFVYGLGQAFRTYYEGIADLDPMGRVMQIWSDLGSVSLPEIDPGRILSVVDTAIGFGIVAVQFAGLIASITPIFWGAFLYNLSEGATRFMAAFSESADHYALNRDSIAF